MTDQQRTVCVVDDDPDMRKALERVLSVHGYRPCSFITGQDSKASRDAAQQVGGAAYLPKPFESKALLDALEIAIRTRS